MSWTKVFPIVFSIKSFLNFLDELSMSYLFYEYCYLFILFVDMMDDTKRGWKLG